MIFSILLISFVVISDENDCKFNVNGNSYDLSPLRGRTATGKDSKISTYHYTAAVCADMNEECEDIMTGQKLRGVVYQMGGDPGQQSVCWDMLAKWNDVTSGPLDRTAPTGSDGFTLQFNNGDPCRGSPRQTKMNMICDSEEIGELSGYQDDNNSCLFIIDFKTSHACSGNTPPPGPDTTNPPGPGTTNPPGPGPEPNNESTNSGVSVGWILIIVTICLVIFYLAGFFIYGGYTTKEWKTLEHCPHTDFWSKFVGWVKLGCIMSGQYSWSASKRCFSWCKSKMGKGGDGESSGEEDPEY